MYDPKTDQWSMLPCKLNEPTSYAGLVLLDNSFLEQLDGREVTEENESRSGGVGVGGVRPAIQSIANQSSQFFDVEHREQQLETN